MRGGRGECAPALLLAGALLATLLGACRSAQSDIDHPGRRVRPPVAFEMLSDAPSLTVVDLRRPEEFGGPLGHLARARNIPLERLPDSLEQLDYLRELTFLVYCRGWDDCGDEAMRLLIGRGFYDAVLMEGGIEAWLRDGFGTVGGVTPGPAGELPEDPGLRLPTEGEGGERDPVPEPP